MIEVSAERLRELLPMTDAIAVVREAFLDLYEGRFEQPPRLALEEGSALVMMARSRRHGGIVVKTVTIRASNRTASLPTIHGIVAWFDEATGRPLFIIDGSGLTTLRTGAASGVATRALAAPTSEVLAVIGAGRQAPDQIHAVCAVLPITEVRLFSKGGVSAEKLAARMSSEFPQVRFRVTSSSDLAIEGADVICCATNAQQPVLREEVLGDRVHVNAIGSYRRGMQELPQELLAKAGVVVVDQTTAALSEAGELIEAVESGTLQPTSLVELGSIIATPPADIKGITVFKSVGVAAQDWAIANAVDERLRGGVGKTASSVSIASDLCVGTTYPSRPPGE
jgi:ornithine cyclodeaminase